MPVHPYATLAPDPTTVAVVSWLHEGGDGSGHTLTINGQPHAATGEDFFGSGTYLYEVEVSGLSPGTLYEGVIDYGGAGGEAVSVRTLPSDPGDGVRIAFVSDMHIDETADPTSMLGDEEIQPLADKEPDILVVGGDMTTNGSAQNPENRDDWIRFFRDYISRVNQAKGSLVPILYVVGNHDVGNSSWEGTGSVTPAAGFVQTVFKYPRDLDPVGENYGAVAVSDYMQLIALDTHSALPENVGSWLEGAISDEVSFVLPFHHSPLLASSQRWANDPALRGRLREEWAEHLAGADNIYAHFCGHIHCRKRSVPWGVVDGDPGGDRFDLGGDKYLTQVGVGLIEFGDGWRSNRSPWTRWWLAYTQNDAQQFFTIDVTTEQMTVRSFDRDGEQFFEQSFPESVTPLPPPTPSGEGVHATIDGQWVETGISAVADGAWADADLLTLEGDPE